MFTRKAIQPLFGKKIRSELRNETLSVFPQKVGLRAELVF